MRLLFIRHGQTDYNKNKRPQGQEIDVSLNETGVRQVEIAAEQLPNNIDFIISSPLKRAFETAQIVNKKLNKKILLDDNIKKFRYGTLAGKTWPEIEIETGDKDVKVKDDNIAFDYSQFGGDSAYNLKQRVQKFVNDLLSTQKDKTILVTTHGGVIDTMHILFPQKEKTETANATIHEFQF